MNFPQFNDIKSLSNIEISKNIIQIEKELFDLKFRKATRQPFKSHEIKYAKRKLAQSKTILSERLDKLEKINTNAVVHLIEKQDFLNGNF
jgi:large subunit ribosomal protein L29|tara:strand:- start:279 stop:548 length:270 start_codon:yes stop_codon:yes gene_type:complete